MTRFQKTRIHAATAVLVLFGLYATAGLGYAAWAGSRDAAVIWAVIGALSFVAAFVYQRYVMLRRRRED